MKTLALLISDYLVAAEQQKKLSLHTSPLVCVGSLLLIGATFAAASVVALKKQSY